MKLVLIIRKVIIILLIKINLIDFFHDIIVELNYLRIFPISYLISGTLHVYSVGSRLTL